MFQNSVSYCRPTYVYRKLFTAIFLLCKLFTDFFNSLAGVREKRS